MSESKDNIPVPKDDVISPSILNSFIYSFVIALITSIFSLIIYAKTKLSDTTYYSGYVGLIVVLWLVVWYILSQNKSYKNVFILSIILTIIGLAVYSEWMYKLTDRLFGKLLSSTLSKNKLEEIERPSGFGFGLHLIVSTLLIFLATTLFVAYA